MDGNGVAGEVVTAATALAGLILIYIGTLVTAYETRQPGGERNAVKIKFLSRAWLAFVGFAFALSSAILSVIGKWISSPCVGNVSVWLLLFAFAAATFATVQAIREIK
jgi:hypothetical protein